MDFFAANLKFLLAKSGLSLSRLGTKLNMGEDYLNGLAQGAIEPGMGDLLELSQGFSILIDDLIKIDLKKQEEMSNSYDIQLLVLDVDGVMTDGGMYFGENGEEFKKFNTKDGRAIINLGRSGTPVGFLSSGTRGNAIQNRAKRLQVNYVHVGTEAKEEILGKWIEEMGIEWSQVAFIGDDVNDRMVLGKVGLSACPSDAVDLIQREVDIILNSPGGGGAVREFVEKYLLRIE